MKELSIEEKAEAYNKAIERAKYYYNEGKTLEYANDIVSDIFPELKESEDEKIRRALISFHKSTIDIDGIKGDDILTWLEKQGEHKSIWHNEDEEPQRGRLILLIMQSGTPIVAKIIEPNHTFNHGEIWAYIDDLLEKQGEQKTLCDKCKKEHPSHFCQDITALGRCAVEHEQKAANKVEPKFKVDDWVVDKDGDIFKIMRVDKCFNHIIYACRPIEENSKDWSSYSENDIRLWDITEDAKAGDVLNSVRVKATIIFKKWNSDGKHINAYCALQKGILIKQKMLWDRDFEPATKEQRDTLMKAIADAGYTFDFDKKELKKIKQGNSPVLSNSSNVGKKEQKSADKTESIVHNYITPNPQFFQWIYNRLIHIHNENPSMDYMLSLKERVEDMQKSAWSVEDEDMLDNIIDDYDDADEHNLVDDIGKVMWLKSIKQRMEG